jgi:hypothetical protein
LLRQSDETVPNYLERIDPGPLDAVRPDAVTMVH